MEPLHKKVLDFSDYEAAPDDGNRYEIFGGHVYVSACPTTQHQRVARRLLRCLESYFMDEHALGEVFFAPMAVILTNHDIAEPDLLVVDDPDLISKRGVEGPPLLVVEILSPSSVKHDRGVKFERYAELGIRHYWIVDPEADRIECLQLDGSRYELVTEGRDDDTLRHPAWDGLVIELAGIWGRDR